ncbi:ferredoxin [Planomonospora parontospora]|uniref:ferredoxin n=1 Tax=Planomonospora parontospora TaxID=58119 RepID=UPI0016711C28|nr:ferredoxin [Planomonospora parontospora]GGL22389.1 ferredoxin [Planomonospora parontospora subsp. antibiotica]GII15672.1 ferredoxin [Planomonospora parontospora subsp. antibiotica]
MRITADAERCIGSGMCVLTAGEVFDQREDDGKVIVVHPEPPAGTLDAVREAIDLCPAAAISADPGARDATGRTRSPGTRGPR